MKRIAAVVGPTASGKTALAVALAKQFNGEVVSADSMQIYRKLNIGTAKPTAEEMQGVPHHMLDVADPGESYSVSRYEKEATACVEDILSRGKLPIVCGGTGLYVDALIRGGGFLESGVDSGLRAQLEEEWDARGGEAMLQRLASFDPDSAARLHLNDKKRIIRAVEVYLQTGITITAHNARTAALPPRYDSVMIGLRTDPRQILYNRIDRRVNKMLDAGLEQEARQLLESGDLAGTAAQAIGYKEMLAYFHGEATLEQAADLIRQKSRNYAKRQLTWFQRDDRVHWITYNQPESEAEVFRIATNFLQEQGL
jgi:tRNA dimethylallyltransferase